MWLGLTGEERIAEVVDISSTDIRDCSRSKDFLCFLHITDEYVLGSMYHLKINDFVVTTKQKERLSVDVGEKVPVIFSETKPSYVHIVDSDNNLHSILFIGLACLLSGVGSYVLKAIRK